MSIPATGPDPTFDQILVLADIHYGDLAHSERLRGTELRSAEGNMEKAASDVQEALARAGLAPQLILVPGDLTSRGSPNEFVLTKRFITLLAVKLAVRAENVLITYGNHDVDWTICKLGTAKSDGRSEYRRLAAQLGSLYAPGATALTPGPVSGAGLHPVGDIDFVVLNSGIECYALDPEHEPGKDHPHGRIGDAQLEWLRALPTPADDRTRIAVLHHHIFNIEYPTVKVIRDISTLAEGAEVRQELGRLGVDLIVHGHRHHPYVSSHADPNWQKPVALLCAGSFGVNAEHRLGGGIPNTFHVVELRDRIAGVGNRSGIIHTFQQDTNDTWGPLSLDNRNVALDPIHWFGSTCGQTAAAQEVDAMVSNLAPQAKTAGACSLPAFDALPLSLRCQRHAWLAKQLTTAAKQQGCRITGKYPLETPLLTP